MCLRGCSCDRLETRVAIIGDFGCCLWVSWSRGVVVFIISWDVIYPGGLNILHDHIVFFIVARLFGILFVDAVEVLNGSGNPFDIT